MDTVNFNEKTTDQYKSKTQNHWSADPCGAHDVKVELPYLSNAYFDEVDKERYLDQPWLLEDMKALDLKGKKVLEIGFGMGADHQQLATKIGGGGGICGIDITANNKKITQARFEISGYNTELTVGDAENLPYEDNTFDFVYSFGVLHHTPNMEKAIQEVYRVLRPEGKCYIALYNKNSLFFWWTVFLYDWIGHKGFKKYTLKQRLSLIEYPNTDKNLVVKLHTKREIRKLFKNAGFQIENVSVNHLNRKSIAMDRFFSDKFIKWLTPKAGWYIIMRARKE